MSGVVDTVVLVEAVVLGGEDRLLHQVGHVGDGNEVAPLFAKLPDQQPLGGPDPQRDLRPVVRQRIDGRQVRVNDREGKREEQGNGCGGGADQSRRARAAPSRTKGSARGAEQSGYRCLLGCRPSREKRHWKELGVRVTAYLRFAARRVGNYRSHDIRRPGPLTKRRVRKAWTHVVTIGSLFIPQKRHG